MSMALGSGQMTAALGGAQSSASNNIASKAMVARNIAALPTHIKTQGSVFNTNQSFGSLTHNSQGRYGAPLKTSSNNIKEIPAGHFGQLTLATRAAGNMNQNMANMTEKNKDQSEIKDADKMLEEANNLTMKDMWAAA